MKELVTGFGGSVVLGKIVGDKFTYQTKFPRKQKKELKRQMPYLTFHKSQIDYVIKRCVHKDWYADNYSFALKIADEPVGDERYVYFAPCFFNEDKVDDKHIFYKIENSAPVKNI